MSNQNPKLKISKRMAELLAPNFPNTRERIEAEVAAGRADKTGAVMVEVESGNIALIYGYALGSISKLDAELKQTPEGPDKHKLLGEHSAWRALVRQVAPIADDAAKTAQPSV